MIHDAITREVIGAAICVHHGLGPGLLESAYESFLAFEVVRRGLSLERQVPIAVTHGGVRLPIAFRIDMIVEDVVIVEIKAIERTKAIHEAQLLTYLRLANKPVGLLINFNVPRLHDGIVRRVLTRP